VVYDPLGAASARTGEMRAEPRWTMAKPRIRHIALNVQNRDEVADYYKKFFGLEETYRGPNGTVYLSDGHVGVALISRPDQPWGINHFGFVVDDVKAIEDATQTKAESNTFGAVAESWIRDPEGNRIDINQHGWPI
jgi:catechol-2,3-dioxygenase